MAAVSKRTWTHKGETKTAWIVRYRDAGGAHRQKTFERKKDADQYRVRIEGEATAGRMLDKPPTTLKEVARLFCAALDVRLANGAIGRSRRDNLNNLVGHHIVPHLGRKLIPDLTSLDVEEWAQMLRERGNRKTGAGLAPGTLGSVLVAMKMIENYAIKHGFLKLPVMAEARREIGPLRKPPIRTFSVDEVRALLAYLQTPRGGLDPRSRHLMACFIYLAAFCGLRVGEINGLKPEFVDFERSVILVRHSLTRYNELKGPKTAAGVRDVPMPEIVATMLREWFDRYYLPNPLGISFTTKTGSSLCGPEFNLRWNRVRKNAGLTGDRNLHFHALRHFHASFMIEQGVSLPEIARLLGHESFDTTLQVYAHPVRAVEHLQPAFERMALALPTPTGPDRYSSGRIIHRKPPVVRKAAPSCAQEVRTA